MAIQIFATLLFLLIVLANWRRHHHRLAEQQFRYEVYSLRDRLRRLAIEGKLDCNSRVFDFLDLSFSKAIKDHYYMTIFRLVALGKKHSKDMRFKKAYEEVMKEITLNPNNELLEIKNQYEQVVLKYIISQHFVTIKCIEPLFAFFDTAAKSKRKFKEITKSVSYLPETSATAKFVQSSGMNLAR